MLLRQNSGWLNIRGSKRKDSETPLGASGASVLLNFCVRNIQASLRDALEGQFEIPMYSEGKFVEKECQKHGSKMCIVSFSESVD